MMISTKGRYALRVMLDLADQTKGSYIPLKDIAHRQEISVKYLENILASLSRAGLVEAIRGKGGGYRLRRDPANYTLGEIIRAAEGSSLAPVSCLDCSSGRLCPRTKICPTLPVWQELGALISGYLDSKHLSDIVGGMTGPEDSEEILKSLEGLGQGLCK